MKSSGQDRRALLVKCLPRPPAYISGKGALENGWHPSHVKFFEQMSRIVWLDLFCKLFLYFKSRVPWRISFFLTIRSWVWPSHTLTSTFTHTHYFQARHFANFGWNSRKPFLCDMLKLGLYEATKKGKCRHRKGCSNILECICVLRVHWKKLLEGDL